jgi:hypothetical protein
MGRTLHRFGAILAPWSCALAILIIIPQLKHLAKQAYDPMLWPGQNHFWTLLARRLCAAVVLLSYLVTISGLPLPSAQGKDRSRPFPCQDHTCGCRTAEQCWRHCCCFTPEEKGLWAQAHHVEPPSYAEVSLPNGWQTARIRDQADSGGKACRMCSLSTAKQGVDGASGVAEKRCCATQSPVPSCDHGQTRRCESDQAKTNGGLRWAHGMSSLRCQGLSALWVSAGAVLPPPSGPDWCVPLDLLCVLFYRDASPVTVPHAPLPPPPRSLSA